MLSLQSLSNGDDCRTAPATPGLLKSVSIILCGNPVKGFSSIICLLISSSEPCIHEDVFEVYFPHSMQKIKTGLMHKCPQRKEMMQRLQKPSIQLYYILEKFEFSGVIRITRYLTDPV